MKFLDQAKVFLRSGNGGPGALSFRRENSLNLAVRTAAMAAVAAPSSLNVLMV